MKRLLCVVLFFLALPWSGVFAAEASEEKNVLVEHLLWDVPFGMRVKECLALIKERTGVELAYSLVDTNIYAYNVSRDQTVTFMGYPANLFLTFSEVEEALLFFSVTIFGPDEWNLPKPKEEGGELPREDVVRIFREVMDVYREMEKLCGPPMNDGVQVIERGFGLERSYPFPMQNGVLDEALVEEVFIGFEEEHADVYLFAHYEHKGVRAYVMISWQGGKQETLSISLFYSDTLGAKRVEIIQ